MNVRGVAISLLASVYFQQQKYVIGIFSSAVLAGLSVIENEKEHFSRWREFLLICCIPSFLALFGLLFMPESPRYLLEAGREVEAMLVYQVYRPLQSSHTRTQHMHITRAPAEHAYSWAVFDSCIHATKQYQSERIMSVLSFARG